MYLDFNGNSEYIAKRCRIKNITNAARQKLNARGNVGVTVSSCCILSCSFHLFFTYSQVWKSRLQT